MARTQHPSSPRRASVLATPTRHLHSALHHHRPRNTRSHPPRPSHAAPQLPRRMQTMQRLAPRPTHHRGKSPRSSRTTTRPHTRTTTTHHNHRTPAHGTTTQKPCRTTLFHNTHHTKAHHMSTPTTLCHNTTQHHTTTPPTHHTPSHESQSHTATTHLGRTPAHTTQKSRKIAAPHRQQTAVAPPHHHGCTIAAGESNAPRTTTPWAPLPANTAPLPFFWMATGARNARGCFIYRGKKSGVKPQLRGCFWPARDVLRHNVFNSARAALSQLRGCFWTCLLSRVVNQRIWRLQRAPITLVYRPFGARHA